MSGTERRQDVLYALDIHLDAVRGSLSSNAIEVHVGSQTLADMDLNCNRMDPTCCSYHAVHGVSSLSA